MDSEDTLRFSSSFSDDGDDSFGSFQSANADGHVGYDGDGPHKHVHGNWNRNRARVMLR